LPVENDYLARLRLEGRRFVVLGAGSGIGREASHALAQAGASVVCFDRDAELAHSVAAEVAGHAFAGDVLSRDDVERAFAAAPVHGTVSIVGMPHLGPLDSMSDDRWRWQFDVVVNHAFLTLQIGGAAIARSGGGSMVFIGSNSGVGHNPNQVAYGAAKAALHHLVGGSARELARTGVRVNAVAPGFTKTPRLLANLTDEQWQQIESIIPRGSAADPSEIASVVLFLASELSSYVTGQVVLADGGLTGTVRLPALWET
jgi:NAD(P)-dependent dehydrogenase (short-subunit alcohol dehydrogenase family)